ncbi:catechol-2,3-dioxygenase membrane subunit [Alkalihalophilus pseudofirmus OF4]|uniref:Catechol-2,3-dioxygenase membrane subunit n=1 Tax=Alkalihalophilus pseudofirmus (strain ATCC BAA-2126 / JCM 17055 / OF4) TaxID=398511 RepID=D3FRE6_ALKPO|nr:MULTISPECIES: DoxX family protein [Alkalihalophilus]ADC51537.1 catechol-2,3-dioxygenase membrane subunit [Alkalihalophilus pseudofirmus OF4]MED1603552.1 DoxX family protein [Alkalihalophilus marmarensis]
MAQKFEVSLLIIRVVLGVTFLIHGIDKFQMGLGNVAGWFESIGIMGFFGYVVASIELVGGIALILGVGTRIISALIGFIMLGAIFMVKLPLGFMGAEAAAGYELDIALLAMAAALVISGSKLLALDNKFFGNKNENSSTRISA